MEDEEDMVVRDISRLWIYESRLVAFQFFFVEISVYVLGEVPFNKLCWLLEKKMK